MAEEAILSAQEFGSGIPILFIHGWQMDSNAEKYDFEPVFSSSSGFRRIYVDLPAHGSSPSYQVQDLNDIYMHLTRFIAQRIGSASHFLLVGSSCGAYLARALAIKHAQQVDGLLLRVPLIQPDNSMRDVDPFQPLVRNSTEIPNDTSSPTRETEPDLPDPILIHTPAYITALHAKSTQAVLPAVRRANTQVLDPIRNDPQRYQLNPTEHASVKQKFFAPTLILTGRHDTVVGYRDSLALTEIYPRSTYVVLDRGTHGLPVDEGGVFEALVRDWLGRVDEWRLGV